MDCSCGCIAGNCPSCFACLACCECHLDRPTLDALETEWREELRAAAAERQSAESESSPQPAKKSKAKGRRDRMTALVCQRRDTAIARIVRAESEQKKSEKQGQTVKRQPVPVLIKQVNNYIPYFSLYTFYFNILLYFYFSPHLFIFVRVSYVSV